MVSKPAVRASVATHLLESFLDFQSERSFAGGDLLQRSSSRSKISLSESEELFRDSKSVSVLRPMLLRSKSAFSKATRSCGAEREKLRTYFERSRPKQGMLRTPKDVVLRRRGSSRRNKLPKGALRAASTAGTSQSFSFQ